MVEIEHICNDCDRVGKIDIYQTAIAFPQLRYAGSFRCSFCGSALEMDGIGFPPKNIRQIILEGEGKWKLMVDPIKLQSKAKLLKIIRQRCHLSLKQVSSLKNTFPDIMSGTKTEMEWLQKHLSAEEIESSVEQVNSPEDDLFLTITLCNE